jgi:hypothetical protein
MLAAMATIEPPETDRVGGGGLRYREPGGGLVEGLAEALPPIHAVAGAGARAVPADRRFYEPGSPTGSWPPTGL